MKKLLIHPTTTAEWHALVNEAEYTSSLILDEELESYLVFLLMRFIEKPDMVSKIIAIEFLNGVQACGNIRSEKLRDVGDHCLLFSGLFPEIAKKRRVEDDYFVKLGQNAYSILADLSPEQLAQLYNHLCQHFQAMKDVLVAIRQQQLNNDISLQSLFDSMENSTIQIIGKPPLH